MLKSQGLGLDLGLGLGLSLGLSLGLRLGLGQGVSPGLGLALPSVPTAAYLWQLRNGVRNSVVCGRFVHADRRGRQVLGEGRRDPLHDQHGGDQARYATVDLFQEA